MLMNSGLAVRSSPFDPNNWDARVPKRVKNNGFCYSTPEGACIFCKCSPDALLVCLTFWISVGLELVI